MIREDAEQAVRGDSVIRAEDGMDHRALNGSVMSEK